MFEKYDAYKDSGLESFPEIPKNWQLKKLKFLLDEVNIRSETGDETLLSLSKYKGVIPKDSLDERAGSASTLVGYKKVFKHNLVINKMQAVNGLLAVSELEGITSPDYSVYSAKDNSVNIHYIAFLLNQPEYLAEMKKRVTGVMEGFIRLYTDDLYDIKAILPSIKEQNCIVDFLQKKLVEIDQAIAIKEQQIALLNERKQIVIQKAVTQGLEPNVPMKNSGVEWIGQIPEYWEISANRTIFKERNEQGKEGLPLLSVSIHSGVSNEEISEEDNVRGRVKIEDKSKYILVKKGDIAFNMMRAWQGGIGAVSVDGMVSPAYIVAKPNDLINSEFFEYQYRCPEFIQQMDRYSKGITDFRKRLYWDGFKQLVTVVPPLEEQLKIVEQIKAIEQQTNFAIQIKNQQIEKLKEYKTILINDAVTGKIKVA